MDVTEGGLLALLLGPQVPHGVVDLLVPLALFLSSLLLGTRITRPLDGQSHLDLFHQLQLTSVGRGEEYSPEKKKNRSDGSSQR